MPLQGLQQLPVVIHLNIRFIRYTYKIAYSTVYCTTYDILTTVCVCLYVYRQKYGPNPAPINGVANSPQF